MQTKDKIKTWNFCQKNIVIEHSSHCKEYRYTHTHHIKEEVNRCHKISRRGIIMHAKYLIYKTNKIFMQ